MFESYEIDTIGYDADFEIVGQQVVPTRDATIVEIVAIVGGSIVRATGTSRRTPSDKYNPRIGTLLAYSRAYEKLARKAAKLAEAMISQADHIQQIKPIQAQQKKAWLARQEQANALTQRQASTSISTAEAALYRSMVR